MITKLRPYDPILLFQLYILQKVKKQDGLKSRVLGKAATVPVLPHTHKKKEVLSTAVSTGLLVILSVWMCHCSFLPQQTAFRCICQETAG